MTLYARLTTTALRMLKKYGASATHTSRVVVEDPEKPWLTETTDVVVNTKILVMPDDGQSFTDVTDVQGIRCVALVGGDVLRIDVGDKFATQLQSYTVHSVKTLDPEQTGRPILHRALVT